MPTFRSGRNARGARGARGAPGYRGCTKTRGYLHIWELVIEVFTGKNPFGRLVRECLGRVSCVMKDLERPETGLVNSQRSQTTFLFTREIPYRLVEHCRVRAFREDFELSETGQAHRASRWVPLGSK